MYSFMIAQHKKDSLVYISNNSLKHKGAKIKQKIANIILNKEQKNYDNENKLEYINSHFYIKEVINKSFIEDNSRGVYIIIPSASHSPYYLLIIDKKINIIDFEKIDDLLLKVINYCNTANISEDNKYNYLTEVLKFYEINKAQNK